MRDQLRLNERARANAGTPNVCGGMKSARQYTKPNMYKERSMPEEAWIVEPKRFVSLDELDVVGQRGGTKIDTY